MKPKNSAELIDDLILLYAELVDPGVECRDGEVYLAGMEERDVRLRRVMCGTEETVYS